MDSFARTILLSAVPGVLVGLTTAYVSVRWALRRFRAERWFDRKAEAYSSLFLALADIEHHCTVHLRQIEEGTKYDPAYLDRLGELARSGFAEVRKAAAMGEFLFGPESAKRLQKLERDINEVSAERDIHDTLSNQYHAASSALRDLRPLAKGDVAHPW